MYNSVQPKKEMAQAGGYREELEAEMKQTDPNSHASRLVAQEIDRLTKGDDNVEKKEKPTVPMIEIHQDRPQKITVKIRIPAKEHPRYNFVGKLLGPKGQTLKALQEQTGCKMAIMGRGSMRERNKEEELRKEGGKYAHLNEDLHVLVENFSAPADAYHMIANALIEIRKFLIPEIADEMGFGGEMGMGGGDMGMNGGGGGAPRGRGGAFRGGPPERGGRGSFRGSGPPAPRGAPSGRGGAPPGRGGPRGAPASRGGAPPSRGARAAPPAAHDGYGAQGYGSGGYDQGYDDGYSSGYTRGAPAESSYDYYGGSSAQGGYDSYSGGYDYGDGYAAKATPSQRGAARPAARPHPYGRPQQGGGY